MCSSLVSICAVCAQMLKCALAYTIAYWPCAPRPTDPVPRGQLWPTGPIYSLYTAYIQPINGLYTAYIQPKYSQYTAHICIEQGGGDTYVGILPMSVSYLCRYLTLPMSAVTSVGICARVCVCACAHACRVPLASCVQRLGCPREMNCPSAAWSTCTHTQTMHACAHTSHLTRDLTSHLVHTQGNHLTSHLCWHLPGST